MITFQGAGHYQEPRSQERGEADSAKGRYISTREETTETGRYTDLIYTDKTCMDE